MRTLESLGEKYTCKHEWPEDDCHLQFGSEGLVLPAGELEKFMELESAPEGTVVNPDAGGSYITAFFEAFPRNPNTFIRGEGKTVEDAETAAWRKFSAHSACSHPSFEKRGYNNGLGFCTECGMSSSRKFAPWENCPICNYPTYPNSKGEGMLCHHCDLLFGKERDSDGFLEKYRRENQAAARIMISNNFYSCPDCKTPVQLMRIVSSDDFRLTEDERSRQSMMYRKSLYSITNRTGSIMPNRVLSFPFSVFYECKCETLKLISDLKGVGNV